MSSLSRRGFLRRSWQLPVAGVGLWALAACGSKDGAGGSGATASVCADPRKLTPAENAQRESFHYVEQSTDATKTCAGCAFFTPADSGSGCGKCQVLNGAANPLGHCDSWAARPS